MEVSDCLQLMIALLSGKFELVRARSGFNTGVKQRHFWPFVNPTQNLQLSNPQTSLITSQAVRFQYVAFNKESILICSVDKICCFCIVKDCFL